MSDRLANRCAPSSSLPPRAPRAWLLAAATLAASAGAASAATEIHWADFSATHTECSLQCVEQQPVRSWVCDTDDRGKTHCHWVTELQCVRQDTVCSQVRTPLPDGDLIDATIVHGATSPDAIEFQLLAGPGITAWKQLMATAGVDQWKVWTQGGGTWCNWPQLATPGCSVNSEWAGVLLSPQGQMFLGKAKPAGNQVDTYVLRNLASVLQPGDRVTFTWVKN